MTLLGDTVRQKATIVITAVAADLCDRFVPDYVKLCEDMDEKGLLDCPSNCINAIIPKIAVKLSGFTAAVSTAGATEEIAKQGAEITSYLRSYLGVCHVANVVYTLLPGASDGEALKASTKAKLKAQKVTVPAALASKLE